MWKEKLVGLLLILFGIMFLIFPMFSSAFLSIMIGFSLVCFGLASISMSILLTDEFDKTYSYLSLILGIISLILGMGFMFFLNALTFLVSFQFFIIAFIMIAYGLMGIIYVDDRMYTIRSIIILILGILTILIAVFAASQPVLIAILIGVSFIVDGVFILVIDSSRSLIDKYG